MNDLKVCGWQATLYVYQHVFKIASYAWRKPEQDCRVLNMQMHDCERHEQKRQLSILKFKLFLLPFLGLHQLGLKAMKLFAPIPTKKILLSLKKQNQTKNPHKLQWCRFWMSYAFNDRHHWALSLFLCPLCDVIGVCASALLFTWPCSCCACVCACVQHCLTSSPRPIEQQWWNGDELKC